MPIGFMNYTRRPGSRMTTRGGLRKVYRVRFAKGASTGKVSSVTYKKIAKVAKAVIKRQEEKKMAGLNVENAVGHNASISLGDCYSIIPTMTQGQGSNQRIGDKVRPTALKLDGVVSFNDIGQGYVGVPLHVVVFVLQARRNRDATQISTVTPISKLLDGGLTPASWDGSTQNSTYPINRDEFEVLATRSFKISDVTAENARSLSARYTLSVKAPAVLDYTFGGSTPTNFAPFVVLGWCRDDGVTPSIGQTWIKHTCNSRLYYTDA